MVLFPQRDDVIEILRQTARKRNSCFNLPATTTLLYGPSHERAKETEADGTVSYNFNPRLDSGLHADYRIKANGSKEYVNYIYAGNRPVGTYTTRTLASGAAGATELRYFHLDGQGSIIALTNEAGAVVERLSYDAWGKRRNSNGTDDPSNALKSAVTDHGYTGHEHLDDMGLIHMNGRVYDPRTGRFLQADPTIQSPGNLQSFNRYSYVMNNPFFYTDPSGYFSLRSLVGTVSSFGQSHLGGAWKDLTGTSWSQSRDQYVKPMAAAAIAYYTGGLVGGTYGAVAGGAAGGAAGSAASAAMYGGNLNDVLTAAAKGAVSGAAFGWAGDVGATYGDYGLAHFAAHATAGCVQGELMGGGCGSGAMSGAAGLAGTPYGFVGAVVAGGTVSVLGGGKFGNGARTAGFGYLFNNCGAGHSADCSLLGKAEKSWIGRTVDSIRDGISGGFGLGGQAHFVGVGVSGDVSAVFDTNHAVCLQITSCLNIGPGLALGGGAAYSGSTGSVSKGWSGTVGMFSSGGAGGFAEGQLLVNPAGGVSAGKAYGGVGSGASIGVSGCFSYTGACK